jgi:iron complex outermembrane receptor protein
VELGLDFNGGRLVLSPRLFYREVENYIQGTPNPVAPANMFVNMMNINSGRNMAAPLQFNNIDATMWGFDMDWRYDISDSWSLQGLVNYVRGERDDVHDNLYRIAPLNASAALSYRSARWGAAVEAAAFDRQDKVSATNNEQESDSYALLGLSAYWQVRAGIRLATGIDNVLDENYQDHLGGVNRVSGNPDIARGERLPGNGRNLYLRLDYQF